MDRVGRLHRRHDAIAGQTVLVFLGDHLDVLDAMAERGVELTYSLQSVEHDMVGAVADGMDGHSQPSRGSHTRDLVESFRFEREQPNVIRLLFIGSEERRCACTQSPIGKELEPAEMEHVVTIPGAQPDVHGCVERFQPDILDDANPLSPLAA